MIHDVPCPTQSGNNRGSGTGTTPPLSPRRGKETGRIKSYGVRVRTRNDSPDYAAYTSTLRKGFIKEEIIAFVSPELKSVLSNCLVLVYPSCHWCCIALLPICDDISCIPLSVVVCTSGVLHTNILCCLAVDFLCRICFQLLRLSLAITQWLHQELFHAPSPNRSGLSPPDPEQYQHH